MNKTIITIISIIAIITAIWGGIKIFEIQKGNQEEHQAKVSEIIEDECTEEWKELNMQNTIDLQTNTQEQIKLSPNCNFTFKTHYTGCGHTSNEYNNIPQQLVNKTESEIQELYNDWKVTTFTSNEVILEKEENGECGEHYILRDVDGKIVVYVMGEKGEEEYEKTEIATDYLTETDKITIKEGLKIYGKENLNQTIEDFE